MSKIRILLFVSCFAFLTMSGCARTGSDTVVSILLFNGTGSSPNDLAAIARILKERGFEYATANSRQLNGMSESQIMAYRLIIVPGGNYITIGNNLTPETTQRIQKAVHSGRQLSWDLRRRASGWKSRLQQPELDVGREV